jgi:hypothetical protein
VQQKRLKITRSLYLKQETQVSSGKWEGRDRSGDVGVGEMVMLEGTLKKQVRECGLDSSGS